MYNELSAALLLVHYAKRPHSLAGSENNITAPLLSFSIRRRQESGAETLGPYNVAKTFILKQKFAPGKRECLWLHSMKFYCVQEAKFVSVNLKTFAFATMLLILATRKALFYKALFSCTLPHKFQQVQRRRPRLVQQPMQILLLIRKNCCSVYTAIAARIKIWFYFLLPRGSGNKIHTFFGGGGGGYTTQFFMHTRVGTNLRYILQEK